MKPMISVIIPTKNRAQYLSSAIQSVLAQTFQDFELLIVDAVSNDSTQEVIRSFTDNRIHYIKEEKDRGPSASRNIGIRESKGKFIAFLDDDDLWLHEKLEKQLNIFRKNQFVDFVFTGHFEFTDDRILGYKIPHVKGGFFPKIFNDNFVGNCSTVMVKRRCFDKTGLFDERLWGSEDFDLWIRMAKHCKFDYVREPLVMYRFHKNRITMTTNPNRIRRAQEILYKKYFNEIIMLNDRKRILGGWHYSRGIGHCKCGDVKKGRTEFVKAICNNPLKIIYYANLLASSLGTTEYVLLRKLLFSCLPACFRYKIE